MRAKRAEKVQKLRFIWGALVFPRCFRRPKRAKAKKHLKTGGKRWANCGLPWLRSSVALGSWSGLPLGFRPHSPPAYENRPLPALWCNRFLGLLAKIRFKGILRGFIWVYRVCVWVWLSWGFRGACEALCVYC